MGRLGFLPDDPGLIDSRVFICSGNTHQVSEISEEHLGQLSTEKGKVHIGSECTIICGALTTGQQESSVTTERKPEASGFFS